MPKLRLYRNNRNNAASVSIQRDYYTMATINNDEAEITMYGEIVERQPTDWWSGEPIEGQFIIESEFLKDLKAIEGAKTITIRMNSLGGNAGSAILIHNRLRELAAKGTLLVCIVDGIAMSGGSLIMCACDTVRVNPSSLVMIHKCWSFLFGGYNADELRQAADSNDAWDRAQVAIYTRKSKLSETVVKHMMADTTYMTGKEAVEKGFADELLDDAEPLDIAASADGRHLFVRGRELHFSSGMILPNDIPTVDEATAATAAAKEPNTVNTAQADKTNTNQPSTDGGQEGGTLMTTTATNLNELRAENPELATALMAEAQAAATADAQAAAAAERQRLADIDSIAAMYDEETVREAKYGETPCTAQEMAFRAAQKAVAQGAEQTANQQADFVASGAAGVAAAPNGGEENEDKKVEADVDAGVNAVKKAQGRG